MSFATREKCNSSITRVVNLTKTWKPGKLLDSTHHVLYIPAYRIPEGTKSIKNSFIAMTAFDILAKLGEVRSCSGKNEFQAVIETYNSDSRSMLAYEYVHTIIVLDKIDGRLSSYDINARKYIFIQNLKKRISFTANYSSRQKEDTNYEALVGIDISEYSILIGLIKEWYKLLCKGEIDFDEPIDIDNSNLIGITEIDIYNLYGKICSSLSDDTMGLFNYRLLMVEQTLTYNPIFNNKAKISKAELFSANLTSMMVEIIPILQKFKKFNFKKIVSMLRNNSFFDQFDINFNEQLVESDFLIKEAIKEFHKKIKKIGNFKPINTMYKRKKGMFFITAEFAAQLCKILYKEADYKKILVLNALDGTLPLELKKLFPDAIIVCIEYFELYKDYLRELGFEVIDYKDIGWIEIMKGNFDLVIGNPPYQNVEKGNTGDDTWPTASKLGLDLLKSGGHLFLVTPNGWLIRRPTSSPSAPIFLNIDGLESEDSLNQIWSMFQNNRILDARILTSDEAKKYFPGVGSSFTYWKMSKDESYKIPNIAYGDENYLIDLTSPYHIPNDLNPISLSIHNKLINAEKHRLIRTTENRKDTLERFNALSDDQTDEFRNKIYFSHNLIRYSNRTMKYFTNSKLMFPITGQIHNIFVDSNCGCSQDVWFLLFNSDDEANVYKQKLLSSIVIKYIFKAYKMGKNMGGLDLLIKNPDDIVFTNDELEYMKQVVK